VRLRVIAASCALALLISACGGSDDDTKDASPPAADLTVSVYPRGPDGPVRKRHIRCDRLGPNGKGECRNLAGLRAEQLDPVPAGTACTQIYGGPATARVRGRLAGTEVDARFDRSDGCQIERWDRNRVLLGD
jgi:hypothetical protein